MSKSTENWKWTKLGESVKILDNLRKPINSSEREKRIASKNRDQLIPYYGATGQVGWIDSYITEGEFILIGEDGAPFLDAFKQKAYKIKGKSWVNNHAHILKEIENVTINDFILHYLNSINYRPHVNGTTRLKLTKSSLIDIPFPLPPVAVQRAIVSKIEELFSELDKGIENLRLVQQQLKTYRQAVLKWAFEGKLTNESVRGEEIPKKWRFEKLGNVSEMCLGKMLDKQKNKGELRPYLGNINVRWGEFKLDELKKMPFENDEYERFSLKKGDLVICEGGEPGRCAIWENENQIMMIQKALHRVRVFNNVDVKYVYYYFTYSSLVGTLDRYFTGTTIKHLTGKELKKIQLPLPPFGNQHQIVLEIENRLIEADKLDESINQCLIQSEVMRQSILKRAFEGAM